MMFELRWVIWEKLGHQQLEYRYLPPCVDASGGLCPGDKYTEWVRVPEVDGSHHAVTPGDFLKALNGDETLTRTEGSTWNKTSEKLTYPHTG